ncbi:MAG: hypothetical protein ACI9GW_002464 [Halieaceae bacterium]|jgi:hypothetical protein
MNGALSDSPYASSAVAADRRSLIVLMLAAIVGVVLGFLVATDNFEIESLPETVVARVNHADILLDEYELALRMLASERRFPLNNLDRKLVLERLIEEELLVQHGVSSGLVRVDRSVRAAVIQSVLAGLMMDIEADVSDAVGEEELREYVDQLREVATLVWVHGAPGS